MVNLENILFAIGGNQNIDPTNGHANRTKGIFCQGDCRLVGFMEFYGAAKGEVGAEIAFSGDTAHTVDGIAND